MNFETDTSEALRHCLEGQSIYLAKNFILRMLLCDENTNKVTVKDFHIMFCDNHVGLSNGLPMRTTFV